MMLQKIRRSALIAAFVMVPTISLTALAVTLPIPHGLHLQTKGHGKTRPDILHPAPTLPTTPHSAKKIAKAAN